MNSAAATRARAGIDRRGELVSFRRMSSGSQQTILNQADVKATVAGYAPVELVNGITSGSRKVIVSRLDLEALGFPVPPKKGTGSIWGRYSRTPPPSPRSIPITGSTMVAMIS